jgi:hypothetical protein
LILSAGVVLLVLPASVAAGGSNAGGNTQLAVATVPTVTRTWRPAFHSPCAQPQSGAFVYHWPIKPFDQQHPIRGYFGDPRTITTEPFGEDNPTSPGSFAFHNGIDISAATGTPVYPVVSGTAKIGSGDEVTVTTDDFRAFQYFHITPSVRTGQHVIVDRTILGIVQPQWLHVHLSEIDGFHVQNPLDPGHLEPYHDHTIPQVARLRFSTVAGSTLDPQKLHGKITIAAQATDLPPIPAPGAWLGFPVTPALVAWRLTTAHDKPIVPETIASDFRHAEPPNSEFWNVYAAGTYQNFPVFDHHYYVGESGQYLFTLTKKPLNTQKLPNGTYLITADVTDTCANHGSTTQTITIDNQLRPGL